MSKEREALQGILDVLGTGDCKINICMGCEAEKKEAIALAKQALAAPEPPAMPGCPTCGAGDEVRSFGRDGQLWFGCSRCSITFQQTPAPETPALGLR